MNFARRCWAEIDMDALRHNFEIIKSEAGGTDIMAVVKADAYGHGDEMTSRLYDEMGAAAFAVAMLEEGARLRGFGIKKPVLILGFTDPADTEKLAKLDITQSLFSLDYAKELSAAAQKAGVTVKCHLKLDTGMGRIGFTVRDSFDEAVLQAAQACRLPNLQITGAFMHFCVADSKKISDIEYTNQQYSLFCRAVSTLRDNFGIRLETIHCCNSAGTFAWKSFHLGMVRPGIILYGNQPSDDVTLDGIRPAMTLKARVALVKTIDAGDSLSYGRTFTSEKPMKIATITAGYADGYQRTMSNRGVFSINGKPAPIVGRVCMDQIMVDVSDIDNVKSGDTAILFGADAADSADKIAHETGTISYEILCNISRRVPRVYVQDGIEIAEKDYLK